MMNIVRRNWQDVSTSPNRKGASSLAHMVELFSILKENRALQNGAEPGSFQNELAKRSHPVLNVF